MIDCYDWIGCQQKCEKCILMNMPDHESVRGWTSEYMTSNYSPEEVLYLLKKFAEDVVKKDLLKEKIENILCFFNNSVTDEINELKSVLDIIDTDDICPKCGSPLKTKWSGVECTNCDYWFCY